MVEIIYDSDCAHLDAAEKVQKQALIREGPRALTAAPGIIIGLCPACWPAYTGLLASLGLGFLLQTSYLFAITVVSLAVALAGLGYRAGRRRGFGPLALGFVAVVFIVIGRFVAGDPLFAYLGIALLAGAAVWNAWPMRSLRGIDCRCSETPKTYQ